MQLNIEEIVQKVVAALQTTESSIPVEVSARHVHLSQTDVETLFGAGATLTPKRPLSQTGQFLSEERVRLVGPKGVLENVAVLGPARGASQVELSATDCRTMGVPIVLRESGDTKGSAPILLMNQNRLVKLSEGCIVAKNHIHMNPEDAQRLGVSDQEIVRVRVLSERPLIFDDVLIRVNPDFVLNMHVDFDEANACLADKNTFGVVEKIPSSGEGACR